MESEKNNKVWIIFLIALIGFVIIAEEVFGQKVMKLDIMAYSVLVENLRSAILTEIMQIITNLGGVVILASISLVALALLKNKKVSLAICSNLVLISLLNIILKNIIQRARPDGYRLILESGYSFPSGHSMISTAFYGLIIYFIYKNMKNKYLKYGLCTFLGLLIPLIAISRVYLGVHYASDVISGFLLSIAYLICFISIYNSKKLEKKMNKEKVIKRFVRVKRKKLKNSFKYAICGLKSAYKREQNLKIHIIIMCLVIIAGFVFKISLVEWLVCLIMCALVISEELINTAIEAVVDITMPEINPKAKIAKDVAASAVLVSSMFSVVIGIIIFLPKILKLLA